MVKHTFLCSNYYYYFFAIFDLLFLLPIDDSRNIEIEINYIFDFRQIKNIKR